VHPVVNVVHAFLIDFDLGQASCAIINKQIIETNSLCEKSNSFNEGIREMHSKETRHDLHSTLHIVSSIATFPHCAADGSKLSM